MKIEDITVDENVDKPYLGQVLEIKLLKIKFVCFYASELGGLYLELKSFNYTEDDLIKLICNCAFKDSIQVRCIENKLSLLPSSGIRFVGEINLESIDPEDIISDYYKKLESYKILNHKEWEKLDVFMRICPSNNEKIIKLYKENEKP